MERKFDSNGYWRSRHLRFAGSLSSVGQKSISELANFYMYLSVKEQYRKVLDSLSLPKGTTFLDAGSGIGLFSQFLYERGFSVTAVDVSSEALDAIANECIKKISGRLEELDFGRQTFDAVHSFDVLYHITDDNAWKTAIGNLCRSARNYLILHQRFLAVKQLISSKHVRSRTYRDITGIIEKNGFKETMSIPTHIVSQRLLTYRVSALFPRQAYHLDRYLLNRMEESKLNALGSHHIKVFARSG